MSVWIGGSVADVKQPQAVLPTKNLALTLLPASPRPVFRPFCSNAIGVFFGAIGQRERWTPMASYRAEWANSSKMNDPSNSAGDQIARVVEVSLWTAR